MSKNKKNFQEIRRVMKPRIPLQTLKFTDVELAESIQKVIDRRLEESIKARFNNKVGNNNE